ncbi:MAG: helix-turn-helix transcriptional regulator [Propionibacteriaceae bacterium]|nr:helix-turn-helix transcriptional regulator [Propionibacteriaceae bacterium]
MLEAAEVIAQVRSDRQLTMNALADVSGVPVSTISRIESGKVEPTWSMMTRILSSAGFSLATSLTPTGTDEPFAAILRRLDRTALSGRERIIRRFPAVARLAQVARRPGARRVTLTVPLNQVIINLDRQGQSPVVSSLEAFMGDTSKTQSFTPVIYVDDPARAKGFTDATPTSPTIMFLLPITANVTSCTQTGTGTAITSREWALLDSLASPGRQPDATLYLLEELLQEPVPCTPNPRIVLPPT